LIKATAENTLSQTARVCELKATPSSAACTKNGSDCALPQPGRRPSQRDQFRQFVMALLEQHIDVRPGLGDVVLDLHQAVVDEYGVDQQDQNRAVEQDGGGHGEEPPEVIL
jgi:hypothetical protein